MKNICFFCGNEFVKIHNAQKLCSKSCYSNKQKKNQKDFYLKNKDKIIQDRKQNPEKWREIWKKQHEKSRDKRLVYSKKYNLKNKEKIKIKRKEKRLQNLEIAREVDKKHNNKRKEYFKKYFYENKNKIYKYQKDWADKNKEKLKKWRKENIPKYIKNRLSTDPVFKILNNTRVRLKKFLKLHNYSQSNRTLALVGCTPLELKLYLEKNFLPGMTWDNYNYETWHIDHIKPLSLAKNMDDIIRLKLMHYTNLQPMWAKDNIKKSNKYDEKI